MVRFPRPLEAPVHAGRELVLARRPPAPDGGPGVGGPAHRVAAVFVASTGGVLEPAAPAAPLWVGRVAEADRQEVEPRRRVPLLERRVRVRGRPHPGDGIERPEWTVALAAVPVHPLAAGERLVAARVHPAVAAFALIPSLRRFAQDVEEVRELLDDPRAGVVLVADRVDAQLAEERLALVGRAVVANAPEGLGEFGRAAPDGDVDRPVVSPIHDRNDPV